MSRLLLRADDWIAATRPGWLWLGQLALVALGVHLAADRLDDLLLGWVARLPGIDPGAEVPERAAIGAALALELAVVLRAAWVLAISAGGPAPRWADWWQRRSVESFTRPVFWGAMALTGSYVVAMALHDATAPALGAGGAYFGLLAGALVAWRLGLTGWLRVVGGLFLPAKRTQGLGWAPALWACAVLGVAQLPLWGWVS